jgi:hypothetical protein
MAAANREVRSAAQLEGMNILTASIGDRDAGPPPDLG